MTFGRSHSSPVGSPAYGQANMLSEETSGGMASEKRPWWEREKKKKEDNVRVYSQTDAFLRCQSVNPVNEGLESLLPSN